MNYLLRAKNMDVAKDYLAAIHLYELATQEQPNLEAFMNLMYLYWSCAAYPFNVAHNIPKWLIEIAEFRYNQVEKKAIELYPNDVSLRFWCRYLLHRTIFDDFTENDVLAIIGDNTQNYLLPYMLLYLFDMKKYKLQRDLLLAECQKELTAKNLYIISLIEDRVEEI